MKKLVLSIVIAIFASQNSEAKNLSAAFSYCAFNQPGKSPFIETYLTVSGSSVVLAKNDKDKLQGKIEIEWTIKRNDSIIYFDKYNLLSPSADEVTGRISDFIDQQRIALSNGKYTLGLKISDKNSSSQSYTASQNIDIHFDENKLSISDIEMLESYEKTDKPGTMSKSGYDVVPYANNFYPNTINTLRFYAEIYNAKKELGESEFLVSYRISYDNNRKVANDLTGFKKLRASDVNAVIAEFPIGELTSGNYNLSVEVLDKTNKLIARKESFFQRSNNIERPILNEDFSLIDITNTFVANYTNKDSLKEYIACLRPISGRAEVRIEENQIGYSNIQSMQQFLYYFWSKRDAQQPEKAWLDYKAEVDKVNANYKTWNKKGYETDRGRVYLQYGAPNAMCDGKNEPRTYPYEIWHYYSVGSQTNCKFVFYCHERASNDYALLHSTVTGEPYESRWELFLNNQQFSPDWDTQKTKDDVQLSGFGQKALDCYNSPH